MKVRVGDIVVTDSYDYMNSYEPVIQQEPGWDLKRNTMLRPEIRLKWPIKALAIERVKVSGLVWWFVLSDEGTTGWVPQCEIQVWSR